MKQLSCEQAKQIDMVDYLSSLSHHPQKVHNQDYWYLSPLRQEQTASFKVNRKLNVWFDFGCGKAVTSLILAPYIIIALSVKRFQSYRITKINQSFLFTRSLPLAGRRFRPSVLLVKEKSLQTPKLWYKQPGLCQQTT